MRARPFSSLSLSFPEFKRAPLEREPRLLLSWRPLLGPGPGPSCVAASVHLVCVALLGLDHSVVCQ